MQHYYVRRVQLQETSKIATEMSWNSNLYTAIKTNNIDDVNQLLTSGVVQNISREIWTSTQDYLVWTDEHIPPVHFGIFRNDDNILPDILKLLLQHGFNINSMARNDHYKMNYTVLHLAIRNNKVNTVKLLLESGADPSLIGKFYNYNGTALDWAKQHQRATIIDILETHLGKSYL